MMKRLESMLDDCQFHWVFGMLLVFSVAISLILNQWYLWLFVLIFFVRNLCLRNNQWLLMLAVLVILVLGRTLNTLEQSVIIQNFNFTDQIQTKIVVDPSSIANKADYFTGTSWMLVDKDGANPLKIPVQTNYWYDEKGQVAEELSLLTEQVACLEIIGTLDKADSARNFGVFDYRSYLSFQKIDWMLTIDEIKEVYWPALSFFESPKWWLINQRRRLTQFLRQYEEIPLVGLNNKLFFNLDSPAYQHYKGEFAKLGILHYFSISGFHIYFIRRGISTLLLRIGIEPTTVLVSVFIFLCLYGCLIAWPVGVIRSVSVYYSRKIAKRLNLPFSALDILSIICILLILINPYFVMQIGFILSFLMTYLITFYQQGKETFTHKTVEKLESSFELTLLCLLFSWPLLLNSNAEWIPLQVGILLLFSIIFEKGVMPLMFTVTIFLFLGQKWEILVEVISLISSFFETSWQLVSLDVWQGKLSIITGIRNWWEIICLWLAAILWLMLVKRGKKKRLAYMVIFFSYFFIIFIRPWTDFTTYITILDVGQGDALLYQPAFSNSHWLIDIGGRVDWQSDHSEFDSNFAKRNLLPALKALGVDHISGLIITHPDSDHIGNLATLAKEVSIKQIFISEYTYESSAWQQLASGLPAQTDILVLPVGSEISELVSGLSVFSLPLTKQDYYDPELSNNSSLITQIQIGGLNFLNMGDLSASKETDIIKYKPDLQINLLKLGHHGSRTSTSETFIDYYQPQMAFISAGPDNRYGHPHEEVIECLERYGIDYLSTSTKGAIQISSHPIWGLGIKQAIE